MDFSFDEETELLCKELQKFLDTEVLPLEEKHKDVIDGGKFNAEVMKIGAGIRKKAVEAGFYTVHMAEKLGGGGQSHVTCTRLREVIAKSGSVCLAAFVIGDPPMGPTPLLNLLNEGQKDKYLHPLMNGDVTTCFCLTEPNAGSDIANMETTAVKDGDHYVLNGSKIFISNGLNADFMQVFAVTKKGKGMFGGISLFMVDANTPGITRRLMKSMGDDDFQAEIGFDDVRVPAENMVGQEGFGFAGAATWLSGERLMMSIQAVGLSQQALDIAVEWANTRSAFGEKIGKYQAISFPLAQLTAELHAVRALIYKTAWQMDQGQAAMMELAMCKTLSGDLVGKVADQALQTLGGIGYMSEHPIERIYRMARVFRLGGGTPEIQRRLIAKAIGL